MQGENATQRLMMPPDERWGAFVDSIPGATIFHHPAWMNVLTECYGYHPFVVAVCDERGEIQAGLPMMEVNSSLTGRRWISLPFSDHCDPLHLGDKPPRELYEYLHELQSEEDVPRIELRSAMPFNGQVHRDEGQVLHLLKLSSEAEEVFGGFHRSQVKRNIRRAEREGIKVRWAEHRRDLDVFYNLHVETRRRLGVPVQPKLYFELLWQQLIDAGLGFVLLAYKDSVPIAGAVFLAYKTTLVYKYGASDSDHWRLRPNHLLFWTSIRWGCEQGYSLFDWGKANVSNTGLRNFKNGWGAQESVLTYSVLAATSPNEIPDRLSGMMGTFIRNTPSWVCRVSGELLYKHFA